MADFKSNVIFPSCISYGAVGGPSWNTEIVATTSGAENRNQRWANNQHKYDVSYGIRDKADMYDLIQVFNAVRGRTYAFKYIDPLDNNSTEVADKINLNVLQAVSNSDQVLGAGDGTTLGFQTVKKYSIYGETYTRDIQLPYDVVAAIGGVAEPEFTIGSTGILTFDNLPFTISAISSAANAVLTVAESTATLAIGQTLYIDTVVGMTEINGGRYTVVNKGVGTITLDVNSSAFTAYSSGGTAESAPQTGESVTAGFHFYVPVRFDQDRLSITYQSVDALSSSINLVEVRL